MRGRYGFGVAAAPAFAAWIAWTSLLATPSLASSSSKASRGVPGGLAQSGGPILRSSPVKNSGFAGYRRNGGGGNASFDVTASFVVPAVTGCTSATRAIAPDIDLSNGTTGSGVGLFVGCFKGKPDYFPFIFLNGSNTDYTPGKVFPGDHINLHLSEGPTSAELTFQDVTHNLVKAKTGPGLKGLGFPGIGDDSWFIKKVELGVPDFGTVAFSHCVVNGSALGSGGTPASPSVIQYDRATKSGVLQINTSPLTSSNDAFTTYFKHS